MKRFTLLADGPSDEALMPILHWMWQQHRPGELVSGQFADLDYSNLESRRPEDRMGPAVALYPCDVLFVHRDAEKEPMERRIEEIRAAFGKAFGLGEKPLAVCVVPVRMSEAWMLFDETAIRRAAENPNGIISLLLPPPVKIEKLPDPKAVLHDLLRTASGLPPQRLRRFNERRAARLVTQFIHDFSPLRNLTAFRRLEDEFKRLVLN